MKKSITITKREPPKCSICKQALVEFWINYRDPAHPGTGPMTKNAPSNITWPTASLQSCAKCLEVAVYKLMKDEGLLEGDYGSS